MTTAMRSHPAALLAGLALVAAIGVGLAAHAADETDRPVPGAYCPLPEKGEVTQCLAPARDEYEAFFTALDGDAVADESAAELESAVERGSRGDDAYLALSSLTYGYYRLATRAAAEETADPDVVQRLSRWNDLLARAYAESPGDAAYRDAVRRAAEELRERAPVTLPCRAADGTPTECTSTESILRGFNAASESVGLRGALSRLLRRIVGDDS